MLLNLRAQYATTSPRAAADAVISALTPAAWYRNATDVVSSGGFASIWADYASSDKGLVLPGVAGNYASAPDSVPLSVTGNIDISVRCALNDYTPAATSALCGKWQAGQLSWIFYVNTSGTLTLNVNGVGAATSSAASGLTDGAAYWVRTTKNTTTGDVNFYYAADSTSYPSSWTQIGTTQAGGVGSQADTTAPLEVGSSSGGTGNVAAGVFYRAIVKDGIDGTTVFDADFSSQAIGAGSFTESSSNAATVTINTSGASPAHIGKARDLLQGTGTNQPAYSAGVFTFDGADNWMRATYASTQPRTRYIVYTPVTWGDTDHVINGSSANVALFQVTLTPRLEIYAGSSAAANTGHAVGALAIDCVVFNGASSSLRVNNNAKTTGNTGANNPGGLTIAAQNSGLSGWSNIAVYEVIDFAAAHSDAEQDSVITALANALSVTV